MLRSRPVMRTAALSAFEALFLGLSLLAGCSHKADPSAPSASASLSAPAPDVSLAAPASSSSASASSSALPLPAASASASSAPAAEAPAQSPDCPINMALVEGAYCPLVEQTCLEYAKDAEDEKILAVCLRFQEPSRCTTARRPMRFCMDRFEYPNTSGEKPVTLMTWEQASKQCEQQGKRLCSEPEFNFACEGESMLPYTTGFERPSSKCNIDKPFRNKHRELRTHDKCFSDPSCTKEFERLDQRSTSSLQSQCVSPFGVYDLNGNVNEWVQMPNTHAPHRAGLKGGWWGPVRNRCRAVVTGHGERYTGYEVGFRCCADAKPDQSKSAPSKAKAASPSKAAPARPKSRRH